jgi:flagella basal body P-ring formation protein FlgA
MGRVMNEKVNQASLLGLLLRLAGAMALCGLAAVAQAQALVNEPELMRQARRWVEHSVSEMNAKASVPLRMEVTLGSLDSRLRLASCPRVEPYLPPGTRLWGKTRLGLRCLDGVSRWNVFVPVTVKAVGRAWVVRRDVAPGTLLDEADLMQSEVDWAEDASPIVAERAQWLGQVTVRSLSTGQALRQNMVRPAQVFQAGAQVRVLAGGVGFQITADGQALSAGVVGQLTRVRMDNGRVMSGTVLDARTVKLDI